MITKREDGGRAAAVVKWTAALGGVAALFATIVGPISDHFETELRQAELDLKKAEVELERTKAKQAYVLAALGEFDDPEEELALLLFMRNEYNDAATIEWVKVQGVRLEAIIAAVAIEKEQQRRETEKSIADELNATAKAAGQGPVTTDQIEQNLTTEQLETLRTQQNSIMSTQLQLQAANQLIGSTAEVDTASASCAEDNIRAVVYKPFATDRPLSDYEGVEHDGIIAACSKAQPSSASEWKVQFLGPGDRIAKRITCTCLSRLDRAVIEERKGFRNLIESEYDDAIAAFDAAEKIYPEFHQVYEISQLLKKHRARLDEPRVRRDLFQQIVSDLSWKAPPDLLEQMKQEIDGTG